MANFGRIKLDVSARTIDFGEFPGTSGHSGRLPATLFYSLGSASSSYRRVDDREGRETSVRPSRRPRPLGNLERDHRRGEFRREVESPAGARRGVLHLASPLLLRLGADRNRQRHRPARRRSQGAVRLAAGKRRDRLPHRARLGGALRRQPARRSRHRPERRRAAGLDGGAGQYVLREQPLAPCGSADESR